MVTKSSNADTNAANLSASNVDFATIANSYTTSQNRADNALFYAYLRRTMRNQNLLSLASAIMRMQYQALRGKQ